MPADKAFTDIISGLKDGCVVPYLGPCALKGVSSIEDDTPIPADSDSLILAMNNGQPMAPRLMYEFPRAAMNLELKKGRLFIERFLTDTYLNKQWSESPLHRWLTELQVPYIIDINRDIQLQTLYSTIPHTLIVGSARVAGTDYRFQIYHYDGEKYQAIKNTTETLQTPILFKPMGTPLPEPSYIAADADYVDYITELMGGFAIPAYIKQYRVGKKYLFMGMNFTRDTERMVMSDIVYSADEQTGWALIPEPTQKEQRFCSNRNIEIIEARWQDLINSTATENEAVA